MIPYNTELKPIVLPEFGRNVQEMVGFCMTLPTKEERNNCVQSIVKIMSSMFPELVGDNDDCTKIWNQINIISEFQLDVDFPEGVITAEKMHPKPQKIPYTASAMRYRHYGKSIENMIGVVADMEESEEKDKLISMITHQMKKLLLIHNKEGVDDAKILRDLKEYSNGKIDLDPDTYLLHEFKDASQPTKNAKNNKRRKK